MARNIEIKARVTDLEAMAGRVATLAVKPAQEIYQDDTFFHCPQGRLKLRVFKDGVGELIFYRRADAQGPKESFYQIASIGEPETLRETLSLAYGLVGRVRKQRLLFLAGRTRIHLDRVDGLGDFVELEVVLSEGEPVESGIDEAYKIMESLGIQTSQLIESAYIDLLAQSSPTSGGEIFAT